MSTTKSDPETPVAPTQATASSPAVPFERIGVQRIPERDRVSTPWTFFRIFMGGSVALGNVLFGWIPLTFGLGLVDALTSITAGTLVALPLMAPLILIGSRTATNNSTSSGAFFGVRGRLIGSSLGIAIMLTSSAIAIWTGGSATVAAVTRLFGTPRSETILAATHIGLAVLAVLVAVYGYHLLVKANAVLMVAAGVLVLLMLVAFGDRINLGYSGGEYLLGSFWRTWILSALSVGVGAVMFVSTIMGDWTRYISPERYPTKKLLPVGLLSIFIGFVAPSSIGAIVTTAFADPYAPFPESLAASAPTWYAVVLLPLAFLGGLGFAALTLYSAGLDLDAIAPRMTRAGATVAISVVSVGLVLLGSIVWDAEDAISSASLLLLALSTPWAAIVAIGHLRCRGQYHLDDLQVFNRGERGGVYWYTGGWNRRAVIAWVAGAIFGVLALQTGHFTGPLANLASGIDVSFLGSFTITAVIYLVQEVLAERGKLPW